MMRMTRKTRIFVGVLFVSALLIGAFVLTSFAAPPQAKAASIGVQYYTDSFWLDPGQADGFISVFCQPGEVLLGGGWTSGYKHMYVWRSMPLGTTGWMIGATNTGSARNSVNVWVSCANGSVGNASTRSVSQTVTVSGYGDECVTVSCSSPRPIASGGGFDSSSYDPSKLTLFTSRPTNQDDNEWYSCFYNPTNTTRTFTAYAVCTNLMNPKTGSDPHYRYAADNGTTIPRGEKGYDNAPCYSYETAISGGFETKLISGRFRVEDWPTARIFSNMAAGSWSNWRTEAYLGATSDDLSVKSWAKCFNPNP